MDERLKVNECLFPAEAFKSLKQIYDFFYPAPDVSGRSMHIRGSIDGWHPTYSCSQQGLPLLGITKNVQESELLNYDKLFAWIPKPHKPVDLSPLISYFRKPAEESLGYLESVSLQLGPYMYTIDNYPNGGYRYNRRILVDRIEFVENQLDGISVQRLADIDYIVAADGSVEAFEGEVNKDDVEQLLDLLAYLSDMDIETI